MQPAMPIPTPSGVAQPGPVRSNPGAAAATPAAGNPTMQPTSAGAPTQDVQQKMAALERAEVLSLFLSYGLTFGKSAAKASYEDDVTRGGAVGAGLGALGGAATGLHTASNIPIKPDLSGVGAKRTGMARTLDDILADFDVARKAENVAKQVPALPMGQRLRAVIKQHGMSPVLKAVAIGGATMAGMGALGGAFSGSAVHGYRHRKKEK